MEYIEQINSIKSRLTELCKKNEHIKAQLNCNLIQPKWELIDNEYEPDSSPVAWTYFICTYKELFLQEYKSDKYFLKKDDEKAETFWIQQSISKHKRICGTFKYDNYKLVLTSSLLDIEEKHNIGIAGDCCFNFNKKKIGLFASLLCNETNIELRNIIMDLIFEFHKMHHSPLNFALMPTNGSLNNFKGSDDFDRLTFLLYWINEYYKNQPTRIFSFGKGRPLIALNHFLSKLKNDNKKYHEMFYPEIDENLYIRLLTNGKKDKLKSTKDIIEYLELAIDFWEAKAAYFESKYEQYNQTNNSTSE